jgi:histidyl-tRNA synthetase
MTEFLCDDCCEHHEAVRSGLELLGVPFVEDAGLVRGLDYYTRTAFEFIGVDLDAAQNAVGGGGRYDGLAESLGGRKAPGVGFALGIDRIVLAIGEEPEPALDIYVVSETSPGDALALVSELRGLGFAVDYDLEGKSVKSQFKAAGRTGAPITMIYHGDDQDVSVRIEDERHEVPVQEVPRWLTSR